MLQKKSTFSPEMEMVFLLLDFFQNGVWVGVVKTYLNVNVAFLDAFPKARLLMLQKGRRRWRWSLAFRRIHPSTFLFVEIQSTKSFQLPPLLQQRSGNQKFLSLREDTTRYKVLSLMEDTTAFPGNSK